MNEQAGVEERPSDRLRLLLGQMCSTNTHTGNIPALEGLCAQAAEAGCNMLCLPEASGLMNRNRSAARQIICQEAEDPYLAACREQAARYGLWLHNGSSPVLGHGDLPVNRSCLIDDKGEIVARYDKIHLFDVRLADGTCYLESSGYEAGVEAVVAETPWGRMGLSVCYDLRFPHLYRDYAKAGARLMFVPSAFTRPTGAAHWEVLLRARAIENGCFVVAAAQSGEHDDGRQTYGHSLIANPWGVVVTDLKEPVGSVVVDIDLSESDAARQQIPSLENQREYEMRVMGSPRSV
ncbi:carbon-nitrogen hydrolase family protein [Granulosicoccus antarcticus]|uniref:Hydrolase n=1 Tax=Granulosicoccus antarcticus IMCC3135 TaxID=1192854 RepID=A0A2Z2NZ77_9GAMM|nr:carbon-nitrogen hydrolase family protein [Granulosicoccus antarcticus]ASJ75088.1 Hydrolase [Granulosicoccus antarcticus IMCC3135]